MKIFVSGLIVVFAHSLALAQTPYWQQKLNYKIEAALDDVQKTVTGFETVVYKNQSPDTLTFIWFHIWPNAYRSDSTALMKQILSDPERAKKKETIGRGFLGGLSFKVNGQEARIAPHPNKQYVDIVQLSLPKSLLPGDSVTITTPFQVKLPPYFSRSGYAEDQFMICQWYPKPAVYDKDGWHELPYLDRGEFYSEYADYEVSITLPAAYVVGATGTLETAQELARYRELGSWNTANRKKKSKLYVPDRGVTQKTLRYVAHQVPDFAWFATQGYVIQYDTVNVSGKVVDVFSYFKKKKGTVWLNSVDFLKDATRKYSRWVGAYGYPTVQAVEGPKNNSSGGMEYPMITLITSPDARTETLDAVIAHEVGHNWFMSMLGSNERKSPWMDEGLNTFFQFRYEAEKYRSNSIFGKALPGEMKKLPVDEFLEIIYNVIDQQVPMPASLGMEASQYTSDQEYALAVYIKTALWMYVFEGMVGAESAEAAIQNYFSKWKNKHPGPLDLRAAFEEATGQNLDALFRLIDKEGKF